MKIYNLNFVLLFSRWFSINQERFVSSLVDLAQNQRFTGIVKKNIAKMGLSKVKKFKPLELPGSSFDNPLHLSETSDEAIEVDQDVKQVFFH